MDVGKVNNLTITRATENGIYLVDAEANEVLLPNRYVPEGYQIGDQIELFVYFDSEDRIVATTERPMIMVGEVGVLEVVGITGFGAFMDWGLPKDLLVPKSNQLSEMNYGERHPIMVYLDNVSGRIVGTAKVNRYINNEAISVRTEEEVQIVLAQRRGAGFRVIINAKHWGMLYDNQIFTQMALGDHATAWIDKITDEGRIDVSLQQKGLDQVVVAASAVMEMVKHHDGLLPYGDRSTPEEIQASLGMSKKVFKRALGYLMNKGELEIGDYSCHLKRKN